MKKALFRLLNIGVTKASLNVSSQSAENVPQELLTEMWRTTGIPLTEFNMLYRPLFENAFEIVSTPPAGGWPPQFDFTKTLLKRVYSAMRIRQSYILPRNAEVESIGVLSEAFTYALVSAMVLEAVGGKISSVELDTGHLNTNPISTRGFTGTQRPRVLKTPLRGFPLLLAGSIVPDEGMNWLYQHRIVLTDWLNYFVKPSDSVISEIASRASNEHSVPSVGSVIVPAVEPLAEVIRGADSGTEVTSVEEGADSSKSQRQPPKGWLFVAKVKSAISEKSLTYNEPGALVQVTGSGKTLLVTPGIFDWYEKETGIAAKTAQNQFVRLSIHSIKADRKNYHKGHLAEDDRASFKGLLIEDWEHFWSEKISAGKLILDDIRE